MCVLPVLAGAFSCTSAPPAPEARTFEPLLDSIRSEAKIVFAHSSSGNLDGLAPYLVHGEPVVRALAYDSISTAIHYFHRGAQPPAYDPFWPRNRLKNSLGEWKSWLKNLERSERASALITKNPHGERLLLEAAIRTAARLRRVRDIDLLSEFLDSRDDYVRGRALRMLHNFVGGPQVENAADGRPLDTASLCAVWQKWWQANRESSHIRTLERRGD